jgi:Sap, sulfolipid-1-addressing protein
MAFGIAITPLAITAELLLLTTRRARTNGPAFLVGWLIGLGIVGGTVLVILGAANASYARGPKPGLSWLKIVLGILLILAAGAALLRRSIPRSAAKGPRWADKLETVRPPVALGFGAAFAGARPKNIILIVAGATAIAQTGASVRQQSIAYVVFAAVATIGVAIPVAIYFIRGDRAPQTLQRLEQWLGANGALIIAVVCLVIGIDLIGIGIAELK